MSLYIQVAEEEGEEPMEIPVEDDGTLLLSTLSAQFPGSCGLRFRNPESGAFRGVRVQEGRLYPPGVDNEWENLPFIAVFPKAGSEALADNKRKGDQALDNPIPKTKKMEAIKCSDLIVLGLDYSTTEESMKNYFSQFGRTILCEVKKMPDTQKSRGFGFVKFSEYSVQRKVLTQRHEIDGRMCDVKIPASKETDERSRRVFVGRVPDTMNADDLRSYFKQFGEVMEVFIPKPYRPFAFVTFADPEVAQSLCGDDHLIGETSLLVRSAAPRQGLCMTHTETDPATSTPRVGNRGWGAATLLCNQSPLTSVCELLECRVDVCDIAVCDTAANGEVRCRGLVSPGNEIGEDDAMSVNEGAISDITGVPGSSRVLCNVTDKMVDVTGRDEVDKMDTHPATRCRLSQHFSGKEFVKSCSVRLNRIDLCHRPTISIVKPCAVQLCDHLDPAKLHCNCTSQSSFYCVASKESTTRRMRPCSVVLSDCLVNMSRLRSCCVVLEDCMIRQCHTTDCHSSQPRDKSPSLHNIRPCRVVLINHESVSPQSRPSSQQPPTVRPCRVVLIDHASVAPQYYTSPQPRIVRPCRIALIDHASVVMHSEC